MKIKDLLEYELLVGGGGGYPEPEGDVTIIENGQHNVKDYATATVNVPQPSGSTNITENGTHNVKDFEQAIVNVSGYPEPQGSVTIQANGTYNVKDKATAVVDVPQPSGNKAITENGTYNVKDYAYAVVNVSGYPEPSGEFTIWSNGFYDCKDYEYVDVQVENAPTHEWVQAERIDSIEFSYGLEGVNFIIIGANLDGGMQLMWHTEGEEEHEFAVWSGGCTFQTLYDTSRLGEGVIALNDGIGALNDGYNFVMGGDYHLYWW